jgi:MFS family permease
MEQVQARPFAGADGIRFTALLIFTQLAGVLAFTVALPLLADMARDLAQDPSSAWLAKMVSGVLGPSMALGAIVAGWLADKYDRRWLTMAIGTLYVLASVAPSVLGSLEAIVAARFCTGFTAAALAAIGMTMVGDYLPEEKRAGTIGMLSALNMVGSLATLPMAGFVGDAGWRTAFLLYLLILPVILLASPTPLPVPAKPLARASAQIAPKRWHSAMPIGLILLAAAIGIILTVPGIYVSFHLTSFGLGKTSTVGLLMMLNSAVAAVFSTLFGRIWNRSPRAVFAVGFSTMGVGLVTLAYASGYGTAIPGLLLMGAGMGLLAPSVMARVVELVEEGARGKVVGAMTGLMAIAPLIGLTLLEPLVPLIGTLGVMLAIGLLSLMLFLNFAVRRTA